MEVTGKLAGSFVSILGICQNIYLTDVSVNIRFGMDIIFFLFCSAMDGRKVGIGGQKDFFREKVIVLLRIFSLIVCGFQGELQVELLALCLMGLIRTFVK